MNKYTFTAELGWSFSRYSVFTDCKRKYFYTYYGKYDEKSRKVLNLKSMTSYALELGTVVHDLIGVCIKTLQKTGKPEDLGSLIDLYNSEYKAKVTNKTYTEICNQIYTRLDFARFDKEVIQAISNFHKSNRLNYLVCNLKNKNKWQIEGSGYGETRIEAMKAYCKADFVVFDDNDNCIIIDWKTGKKNSKHKNQLYGYANWVKQELKIPLGEIQTIVAYLLPDYSESESIAYNDTDYSDFVDQIKTQTQDMKDYLTDSTNNIPKSKEVFVKNSDDKNCRYCNYYTLCK